MKQSNPTRRPRPSEASRWIGKINLALLLFCLVGAVILYFVTNQYEKQRVLIADKAEIARLDEEFSDFLGPEHTISEYTYAEGYASRQLQFGYGPLYDLAGYQTIIGKTGMVGVICYSEFKSGQWQLYPGRERNNLRTLVFVVRDCVVPQEWWSRPVLASMLYDVPLGDGWITPQLIVWVPWPDEFDFDDPPSEGDFTAKSWYWNGTEFTQSDFPEPPPIPQEPDGFTTVPPTQISQLHGPARGLSLTSGGSD